jgi:hypothetical protein
MMQKVRSFLGSHGFANTKGVLTNDEVRTELFSSNYRLLIVGGGVDGETRKMISEFITQHSSTIKVIEHFGDTDTLIYEINKALNEF